MSRERAYLKPAPGGAIELQSGRQLAVLIVAKKNHELLEHCLARVAEHLPEQPIYVYDSSGNPCPGCEELAARHPKVHWVFGVELSFAAAFNALVEHTPPDADLLMLMPDTRIRGSVTRARERLHQPGTAAVSPLGRASVGFGCAPRPNAMHHITLTRALLAAAGYSKALRGTPLAHLYARQPAESHTIPGRAAGACLAINRAAWNAIGGFDEEFFTHGGEADWLARARGAGWRVLLADELAVDHGALMIGRGIDASRVDVDDVSACGRTREHDLFDANVALLLEHQRSVHHADAYLAGMTLLKRVQPAKRRIRKATRTNRPTDLPSIVIVSNRLVYGGAERQKVLLADELSRRGYPVTIVCVQRFGPLIKDIPQGVRVVRQPWWAPVIDLPPGPAVLISGDTNTETGFATLWRAAGGGRRWLVAPHTPPEEHRPIYSRPLAAAMRRADGFIVLAQRHWDMLGVHHRLGGRRFVAPNGVEMQNEPRPRLCATDHPLHLVMLSRIVEHKNPLLLVEALGGLIDLPWTLSIFGDGPDRERLQARTPTELGDRVHWRGWSAGPGPALAKADLLCVPSRSEAFPMVILEAMARAVPVAASAICAVPEMLDFGRAGYVVEPVSVAGWRDQLASILADPGALPAVGRRGFDRARTHYTVAAMTDAYLKAIGAVL